MSDQEIRNIIQEKSHMKDYVTRVIGLSEQDLFDLIKLHTEQAKKYHVTSLVFARMIEAIGNHLVWGK